jgi:5'-nucleotidase/UDP-sugar diphosphatase
VNNLGAWIIFGLSIILSGVLTACHSSPPAPKVSTVVTILGTNDIHGALDNAPQLTTLVNQIRSETGEDNVLLVDAGDVFSGTLYSTLFQGEAEIWFMNHDKYDAMTLGNHEFDKGSQWLADFISQLDFPVVNANFNFAKDSPLTGKTKSWVIIDKGSASYGIFGLTTSRTKELSSPGPDVIMNDEIDAASRAVSELQQKGINKIIAITHIGWSEDLELAKQVAGIDVIVGGHTHTVPENYPTVVTNGTDPTLVVQAGSQGKYLGRLNVSFDSKGVIQGWEGSQLITVDNKIEADAAGVAKLVEYQGPINSVESKLVGKAAVDLDGDREHVRKQETNLANMVADSMLEKATSVQANIALITGGGIRASIPAGEISLGQVIKVLPYNNYLVTVDITGAQIIDSLENGVSLVEQNDGRFPQIAGLRFTWDPGANPGSRIKSVEISTVAGYKPIELLATYRVVTTNFIAGGGDGYTILEEGSNPITLGNAVYEVLTDYIKIHSPVSPTIEERIKQISP